MRKLWGALAVAGLTVGLLATPVGAKSKPPKACLAALNAAELLQLNAVAVEAARDEMQQSAVTALTTARDFAAALNGVTAAITTQTGKLRPLQQLAADLDDDYQSAARKCRAGK